MWGEKVHSTYRTRWKNDFFSFSSMFVKENSTKMDETKTCEEIWKRNRITTKTTTKSTESRKKSQIISFESMCVSVCISVLYASCCYCFYIQFLNKMYFCVCVYREVATDRGIEDTNDGISNSLFSISTCSSFFSLYIYFFLLLYFLCIGPVRSHLIS